MNVKQKFEKAKAKIAENKIAVLAIGAVVGGAVALVAEVARQTYVIVNNHETEEPEDYDKVVIVATAAARDKIIEDPSFDLSHQHLDLYNLSMTDET